MLRLDETKPEATRLISETSGLFSADVVARNLVRDMERGEFQSIIGLDGFMLGKDCFICYNKYSSVF